MIAPKELRIQFPDKLACLFEPHRYKVLHGGRGGLKSWGAADALVVKAYETPLRILCARENMNSIAESVHHLLESRIRDRGLSDWFRIEKAKIFGTNGSEFIFAGLRHNVANIKSLEAVDIVWVEEAATVSKDSWETLIPTVRKDGSEIWVTFNPELESDDTYKRFVLNPPPGAVVVHTDYRDNRWFPEVLRVEMEHLRDTDYTAYENVWLGQCKSAVTGAIFGEEIKAAEAEGRFTRVPIDRTRPVHTFWDLGYGDSTAIWFAQAVDGWFQVVDYLEDAGKTISHYVIQLQQKGYMYGTDWLPHDAVDTIIHAKLGGDKTRSIEQLMRNAGRNVRVAPKLYVHDRINAARTVFSQCRFDDANCKPGIDNLRFYQWGPPSVNGVAKREPLHDKYSHGADAFCTLAVSIKQPARDVRPVARPQEDYSWMGIWLLFVLLSTGFDWFRLV